MEWITDKKIKKEGFVKKMNLWMKDGFTLSLFNGHTWILAKANYENKDVKTMDEIRAYMANPVPRKSSKIAY